MSNTELAKSNSPIPHDVDPAETADTAETADPAGTARATVRFDRPERRVAPGQSVVLYAGEAGDEVVGGGLAVASRKRDASVR